MYPSRSHLGADRRALGTIATTIHMASRVLAVLCVVASANAFSVGASSRSYVSSKRSASPALIELPELPSLPSLPSVDDLPGVDVVKSFLKKNEPTPPKQLQFDEYGRMIKNPNKNWALKAKAKNVKDNRAGAVWSAPEPYK